MLKYKKGDKVKIRPDLEKGICGADWVVESMLGCRGKVTSVIEINDFTNDKYKLDGCGEWWFTDEMLMPATPTIQEIKDKKISCVVHTKTKEEAKMLAEYMPTKSWLDLVNPVELWDRYEHQTSYRIEDGELCQYADIAFYKNTYPAYGEIYEFSDITASGGVIPFKEFKVGDKVIANDKSPYAITCEGWVGRVIDANADNNYGVLKGDIIVESMDSDSTYFVESKYFDHYDALDAVVTAFDKAFAKQEKEDNHMTFTTTKGERYTSLGKHKGKTITTITTTVNINGRTGSATCDEADYNERDGVLNAIANAYCYGNFDREYRKAVKEQERQKKLACTCGFCGKVLESPEAKAAHEEWHVERKKAKHERYLIRKEARRRLEEAEREGKIEQVMKELCKK